MRVSSKIKKTSNVKTTSNIKMILNIQIQTHQIKLSISNSPNKTKPAYTNQILHGHGGIITVPKLN